uniref:Uncharacterized protein n=1 Tax=Trypanosoma congolense (strain IL3000) TaxID=1068625 RepID=G0UU71_TRYCI|nr:conserved hypothetical protein [Trypanosoma congolense IL3000]
MYSMSVLLYGKIPFLLASVIISCIFVSALLFGSRSVASCHYDLLPISGVKGAMIFKRPHLHACSEYVDVAVELGPLRKCENFTHFLQQVRDELELVYGNAPQTMYDKILYSTHNDPNSFSCYFGEKQLEMLRNFDEAVDKENQARNCYEAALADYKAKVEETADKKMKRRKRIELEKAKRRLKGMNRDVLESEYEVKKSAQRLTNIFEINSLRVLLH